MADLKRGFNLSLISTMCIFEDDEIRYYRKKSVTGFNATEVQVQILRLCSRKYPNHKVL